MSRDAFVQHRNLLFTVAYEMLGSAADAEDVVQETWLRWADVDADTIVAPRAYLVRIVTRQALNRLRTVSRRREDYVGAWLPEPLLTAPELMEDADLAESVSLAMLTVLETLAPTERAVFVLRDVFDTPYDEIAETIGKSAAAVRQIAHRARRHVAERRPRRRMDSAEEQAVLNRFLAALASGDTDELLSVLAPDVIAVADGGGVAPALGKPVSGAAMLASMMVRVASTRGYTATPLSINGMPGVRFTFATGTAVMALVIEDGRITRVLAVNNPQKLGHVETPAHLCR